MTNLPKNTSNRFCLFFVFVFFFLVIHAESNGNEEVLHILQVSRNGASPPDAD